MPTNLHGTVLLGIFFALRAIAVPGASSRPETIGARLVQIIFDDGFTGPVFPVNPKYEKQNDSTSYSSIRAIVRTADVVVIIFFAATVSKSIYK